MEGSQQLLSAKYTARYDTGMGTRCLEGQMTAALSDAWPECAAEGAGPDYPLLQGQPLGLPSLGKVAVGSQRHFPKRAWGDERWKEARVCSNSFSLAISTRYAHEIWRALPWCHLAGRGSSARKSERREFWEEAVDLQRRLCAQTQEWGMPS